jgi:para-aminobenzoate synthetase
LIAGVNGVDPVVLSNDDPALARWRPDGFDNIVISPGPGRPQVRRDLGHVGDLLRTATLPVLGVCLGHQAIAYLAGGTVGPAPRPRHGHLTRIKQHDDELFAGVPTEFTAVRYHSLCVQEPLPEDLVATAWAEDGVVMALRQRSLPRWGVQFHPESIASEYGREILTNFRDLSLRAGSGGGGRRGVGTRGGSTAGARTAVRTSSEPVATLQLITRTVPRAVDTEAAFLELFAAEPTCFWLDSSRVEEGLSRFSFLGGGSGPLSEVLTYQVSTGEVTVLTGAGPHVERGSVFDALDRRLRERRIEDPGLPFDFTGGYVGFFGYEMKADCGAGSRHEAATPDAAWLFADRLIAVDHEADVTYVLAVHDRDERVRRTAGEWVDATAALLATLPAAAEPQVCTEPAGTAPATEVPRPESYLVRGQRRYLADIEECRRQLARGESYEICLTNTVRLPFDDDDLEFYRRLRQTNPAPYAAFLRIAEVAVFSSSPERFLRITPGGAVESRPIKGTAPRSADPVRDRELAAELAASAKNRAENLMIVDLLRNDLGQVCEIGSVTVDRYLAVESYATVHQLVSTIAGRLRSDVTPVACVRYCFPGGSMTGAPKQRTMEIIDRLETEARGVYSGALGYFGLAGGADLSIVIRAAVRLGDELTIGAGGAIVVDSDPAAEFDEMLLKAMASLRAWRPTVPSTALV